MESSVVKAICRAVTQSPAAHHIHCHSPGLQTASQSLESDTKKCLPATPSAWCPQEMFKATSQDQIHESKNIFVTESCRWHGTSVFNVRVQLITFLLFKYIIIQHTPRDVSPGVKDDGWKLYYLVCECVPEGTKEVVLCPDLLPTSGKGVPQRDQQEMDRATCKKGDFFIFSWQVSGL